MKTRHKRCRNDPGETWAWLEALEVARCGQILDILEGRADTNDNELYPGVRER